MNEIELMWSKLEEKLRSTGFSYDYDIIKLAFDTAAKAHSDQRRKTGELYIYHPFGTKSSVYRFIAYLSVIPAI